MHRDMEAVSMCLSLTSVKKKSFAGLKRMNMLSACGATIEKH